MKKKSKTQVKKEEQIERIKTLKLMTMRPHNMAERMLVFIESRLMFGNPEGIEKSFLEMQRNRIKQELMVDSLPTH